MCRVCGEFPDGEIVCEEPILVVSYKVGVCRVDPKGKSCKTVFQKLSYNGKSSVVKCFPHTGRTHQIRVHLQFLGHAIVNDPIYNTDAWGPNKGKGGKINKTNDELLKALVEEHRSKQSLDILDLPEDELKIILDGKQSKNPETQIQPTDNLASLKTIVTMDSEDDQIKEVSVNPALSLNLCSQNDACQTGSKVGNLNGQHECLTDLKDLLCGECKLTRPDPTPKDLVMYLHALRYKGAHFDYSAPMPDWALEDWQED